MLEPACRWECSSAALNCAVEPCASSCTRPPSPAPTLAASCSPVYVRPIGMPADRPLPSLVVCPSTLVPHWPFEIGKFVGPDVLRPLAYHGTPTERAALRGQLASHDVLVMSYESLRSGVVCGCCMRGWGRRGILGWCGGRTVWWCGVVDQAGDCLPAAKPPLPHPPPTHPPATDVDWVCSHAWAYCVLDEGHAIRNPSSKIALAAKRAGLAAQHRLLLSGGWVGG